MVCVVKIKGDSLGGDNRRSLEPARQHGVYHFAPKAPPGTPDPGTDERPRVASEEVLELVKNRSSPGIMILGRDNRLLFASKAALHLLEDSAVVPAEICQLCDRVRQAADSDEADEFSDSHCRLIWDRRNAPHSLRAFLIGTQGPGHPPTHVMVLVEKVVEQRALNLKKARIRFGLSCREIEVVMLVARGLSNKEIGCRLFVSEHTVKDHLKHIMRKLNASSRSEIIAILK